MGDPVLTYKADIGGLTFPDHESLNLAMSTSIGEATVTLDSPEAGHLCIRVYIPMVASPRDPESVQAEISDRIESLLGHLAFITRVGIGPAILTRSRLADRASEPPPMVIRRPENGVEILATDTIHSQVTVKSIRVQRKHMFGTGDGKRLAEQLNEPEPLNRTALAFYRDALRATDVRARFVLLFSLLQTLVGPNLDDVDDWIIQQQPDVALTPEPPRPRARRSSPQSDDAKGKETIYRRIRNEIVHAEDRKRTPDEVLQSASRAMREFDGLIREAMALSAHVGGPEDEDNA